MLENKEFGGMSYDGDEYDRYRQIKEKKKRARRRKRKLRWFFTKIMPLIVVLIAIIIGLIFGIRGIYRAVAGNEEPVEKKTKISENLAKANEEFALQNVEEEVEEEEPEEIEEIIEESPVYSATPKENMMSLSDEVNCANAIVIDMNEDLIVAGRNYAEVINPASMTKVLTVLVAAENLRGMEALDDKFTITIDITDYAYRNDCSAVGFVENEEVTVKDLFYGTILPSGGDAAVGLATYIAGSHEAFVELMNKKLESLGLSDTAHFTNCVGLYDENHNCTPYDMAIIMRAALDNELCREVLSAHIYTTTPTEQHPNGLEISNWFLRRIEDKDCGGIVQCAKTGYVVQSGNCAVSFAENDAGKRYICVTVNSRNSWRCIYDHVAIYKDLFTNNS